MDPTPPRPRPGDRIRASDDARRDEAIRAGQVRPGPGYTLSVGSKGTSVRIDGDASGTVNRFIWIEITGIGTGVEAGFYSWRRIYGPSPGSWDYVTPEQSGHVSGPYTGPDDPAMEANLSGSLDIGQRVLAQRERGSRQLRFQLQECSE